MRFPYSKLNNIFLVAAGAIPASLIRWKLDNILLVNALGCAILGVLLGMSFPKKYKLFLGVGFCGSLTTFSSWIVVVHKLASSNKVIEAYIFVIANLLFGLLAAAFGYLCAKRVSATKRSL